MTPLKPATKVGEVGPEPRRCALCGEYKVFEADADEDGVCNDCPKEV